MPKTFNRRDILQLGAGAGLIPITSLTARASDRTPGDFSASRVTRYRVLGRTGLKMADISFGTSRLRTGQEALVHHALEKGVNYFDTADSYTRGESETVLGRALAGRRDEVILATKTHVGADSRPDAIMAALEGSLRRLNTDHVDIYFNHAVNDTQRLDNPHWYEFVEKARAQGKIRFTGMSGHAGRLLECLEHAVAGDLVDVMLVSYNFGQDPAFYESLTRSFDRIAVHPGLPGVLARASAKNIGVIAMKTLMGARLNDMRAYESAGATFSQAAFRWTLSNPDVSGLVISMTSTADVDEFLGASGATTVSQQDLELLRGYARLNGTSYCRQACNDCEGACPYSVPIADVLRTRMYAVDYRDTEFARDEYAALEVRADACLSCSGAPCQNACTHGLDISAFCAATHRMLA